MAYHQHYDCNNSSTKDMNAYLIKTNTNLLRVNLSIDELGNIAARTMVKSPDVDDRMLTTPTVLFFSASW